MRGLEAEEGKLRESGEAAPSGRPAPLSHQCPPNFEGRISGAAQYFHLEQFLCYMRWEEWTFERGSPPL